MICSFPRQVDSQIFDDLYRRGKVELELVPQGNLAARIQAAGAGLGAVFTPPATARRWRKERDPRNRRSSLRARIPDQGRFRADQSPPGRPLGQPGVSQSGAQLRPDYGDRRKTTIVEVSQLVRLATSTRKTSSPRAFSSSASSRWKT
jgi:3-oxoadipate CoA-transferase alpha subunit